MPIDTNLVRGAETPDRTSSWTADDVILYHLALGAGAPATDINELAYTYEESLKVLPSFAVVPASPAVLDAFSLPGLDVDMAQLLHGEQEIELHDALPVNGNVVTRARVADVFDKGKAALVVLEAVTCDAGDGRPLCTNRFSLFFRGEGGFGGDSGPSTNGDPPARGPDRKLSVLTLPQQALLYRLSGDKNPLHADPAFAARAGFERPILHGLCSYGIACKAAVDAMLDGDVRRVARYRSRFAGVVFPGETIDLAIWDEGDRLLLAAACRERGAPVLSHGVIELR